MFTANSLFEAELKKIIDAEILRLTENLVLGMAVSDYPEYRHQIGLIAAYNRVATEFLDEAQTNTAKR